MTTPTYHEAFAWLKKRNILLTSVQQRLAFVSEHHKLIAAGKETDAASQELFEILRRVVRL